MEIKKITDWNVGHDGRPSFGQAYLPDEAFDGGVISSDLHPKFKIVKSLGLFNVLALDDKKLVFEKWKLGILPFLIGRKNFLLIKDAERQNVLTEGGLLFEKWYNKITPFSENFIYVEHAGKCNLFDLSKGKFLFDRWLLRISLFSKASRLAITDTDILEKFVDLVNSKKINYYSGMDYKDIFFGGEAYLLINSINQWAFMRKNTKFITKWFDV